MPDKELEYLLKQANRCRTVAAGTLGERTRQALLSIAKKYEGQADAIKPEQKPPQGKPDA